MKRSMSAVYGAAAEEDEICGQGARLLRRAPYAYGKNFDLLPVPLYLHPGYCVISTSHAFET